MPTVRQKFSVGLFVIIAFALFILFLLLLGLTDYFREGRLYAAYFRDSVRGLNPGAEVAYQGVEVGRVEAINLAPDRELVEVIMFLDDDIAEIAPALVAMVRTLGITGIMYVELQRLPPDMRPEPIELTFEPEYPVIDTRPSEMTRVIDNFNEFVEYMKDIRVKEIAEGVEDAINHFNRAMVEAEIAEISAGLREIIEKTNAILDKDRFDDTHAALMTTFGELNDLIAESRKTVNRVDSFLEINREPIERSLSEAERAAEDAAAFFEQARVMAAHTDMRLDQYDQRLKVIVDDIGQAANNLNRLLDQLSNHPSQLLFGRPAPPKPIEK